MTENQWILVTVSLATTFLAKLNCEKTTRFRVDLFTEYAHCNYLLKSVSFLKGTKMAESLDFLTKFLKLPVGSNAHA